MTPIEIIALIFIIVAAIKILVILVKPKAWLDMVVKKVWVSPFITGLICLVLAIIVLYYLIQELTIIQIFAVMGFVGLLAGVGIAAYAKEIVGLAGKLMNKGIVKRAWLQIIIWIILIIWGLYTLFA